MSLQKVVRSIGTVGFVFMILLAPSVFAQGTWYATGYLQYSRGNYIFGTNTSTFYLVPGLRYEGSDWSFSAILPIVSQNNNDVTGVGGMLVPHGGSSMNMSTGSGGMMGNSGGMTTMGGMFNVVGLGDLFLSGEYDFIQPGYGNASPTIGVSAQAKVPTASTSHNFGTGKFDFDGSINYREKFGAFAIMANAGYLIIGKPVGVDFRNSFTYGAGVGKFFNNGEFSAALLYQGYTTILSGYPPPNQASLGVNYKVSSDLTWTILLSKGLTDTAPDFGITGGFRWDL